MKHLTLGLLAGLLLLVPAGAHAATVTVEVEGKNATLVPPTVVELPTQPFKPDGTHDCAPNSGGGALQVATSGEWGATWSSFGGTGSYFLSSIKGEAPAGTDYWAVYVNGKYGQNGVCDGVLQNGDTLLYYFDYCDYDPAAQTCTNDSVYPLALSAPARPKPGEAFTVKVERLAADGGRAPVAGATVGGGAAPATTDAQGQATITLAAAGDATITAVKANFVRDSVKVCATTGSDGACGTSVPSPTPAPAPGVPCVTSGDDGFCGTRDQRAAYGKLVGLDNGKRYAKGKGPRELKGAVEADASGIQDVRVRVTSRRGKVCRTYDARTERFKKLKRCGAARGTWFSVGDRQDWTYLLPQRLGTGRWVVDLEVVDKAGHRSKLARGTSRVVFTVA